MGAAELWQLVAAGVGVLPLLVWLGGYYYAHQLHSRGNGRAKVPHGPTWLLPIWGETLQLLFSNPNTFFSAGHKKFGGLYTTHLFGSPTLVAGSPEAQKFFLSSRLFETKLMPTMQKVLGQHGITQVEGEVHTRYRRHVVSLLNVGGVSSFISKLDEVAIDHLKSYTDGETVNSSKQIHKFAFSITSILVIDYLEPGFPITKELHDLMPDMEGGLLTLDLDLPGTTLHKAMKARKVFLGHLNELIARRRKEGGKHMDILQQFLQAGQDGTEPTMSDAEIKDNLVTMFFAAYDTTAITMTWILKLLSDHSHILQQVQEEQDKVAELKGPSKLLTVDDLKRMPLSLQVIHEALRLSSFISFSMRVATTDVEHKGILIPKGWKVLLNYRHLHLGPDNYQDPFKFNPSRFEEPPNPNIFRPFSGGNRLCPGMEFAKQEILVFMHRFLTTFRYTPAGPDRGTTFLPLAKPKGGFPITVHKRLGS